MKHFLYLCCLLGFSSSFALAQTTFIVSSNDDSGPNTLRAAMTAINSATAAQPYSISFTTAGPVSLTAALPDLVQSCTLIGASPLDVNTGLGGTTIERSRATGIAAFRLFNLGGSGKRMAFLHLTLTNGTINGLGGAIRSNPAGVTIINCLLTGNQAATGGAVSVNGGPFMMMSTRVVSNTASQEAGLYLQGVTGTITNSQLTNNMGVNGSGIRCNASGAATQLLVTNTLISNNTATADDAALRLEGDNGAACSVTLVNCTITNNRINSSPATTRGAIWLRTGNFTTNLTLYNTIVFGNTVSGTPSDILGTANPASMNNLVGSGGGLTDGVNNNQLGQDKNPNFRDVAGSDYRLSGCSIAINRGNPSINTLLVDLEGASRVSGGLIDLGAYEYQFGEDLPMYSLKDGAWNDPSVWSCGRLPALYDLVAVGHQVTVPSGFSGSAKVIRLVSNGKLTYQDDSRIQLGN